jgi:broad specificity phosphatase PhoE
LEKNTLHWAETLKTVSFDAIYSTHYIRTQKTAHPFSNRELGIIPFNTRTLFYDKFQQATLGKTVLIVGHSNTTPAFVNKILGTEKFTSLEDDDYNSLFIVYKQGKQGNPILLKIHPFTTQFKNQKLLFKI